MGIRAFTFFNRVGSNKLASCLSLARLYAFEGWAAYRDGPG